MYIFCSRHHLATPTHPPCHQTSSFGIPTHPPLWWRNTWMVPYRTRRCSTICKEFGFKRSTDISKVYYSSFQRALSSEKYWSFKGLWIECSENFKFIEIPRNTDVSEVYESIITGHYLPKLARVKRIQAPCSNIFDF